MIHVKVICYVNVENHFLTFTKHSTFTRIMLGMPLREAFKKEVIFITFFFEFLQRKLFKYRRTPFSYVKVICLKNVRK